ncbi:MAG: SiaC family regulatory phosphoprotein [Bacteroidia bacterium]|nr:SiaC family regulatory phosphoprotein [Bacteroidia bacterium]
MNIDVVHILPTNKTPEVLLNPEGIIKIKGRAMDESRAKFSDQIMIWIDAYLLNPAESTEVMIALEYLNSFNSIILASVLKKLSQVNQQSKKLVIKWYIEEDDDDLLERGNYISSTFNIPIEFIMTDHIKSWY